jgi:hypothetical protein
MKTFRIYEVDCGLQGVLWEAQSLINGSTKRFFLKDEAYKYANEQTSEYMKKLRRA